MPKVVGMDNKVFKQITCGGCGAINEYAPNEVGILWKSKDIDGGSCGAKGFNCANCGEDIITELR